MMPCLKLRALLLLWFIGACSLLSLAQSVTVNPTSVSFSNQAQGTTSAVRKVTLKNGQTSSITITSITSSLSDFAQTNTCPVSPATLAAGASCTISVTFTPSAQGSRSGTLTVTDSGLSSPQLVTLTGTGTAATLKSIAVTPSTATVIAALTQQFTATGTYSDGSTQDLTTTASWTSSSTATATIGLHTGLAKGVVAGTATITASSGTIKGTATLTVTSAVLTSIAVTPATASTAAGKTKQFTATGSYNNGASQNITSSVSWTSSATSFATVSAAGLATGVAQGSASITATSGTISGSATLTVTPAMLSSIVVTPSTASIGVGSTQSFTATGTYSDGSTKNLTTSASWTSSSPSAATIALHTGVATGVAAGAATITATSGTIKGTATLTISPTLTSIAVSPVNPTIAKGNTQQFSATGTFSDGSTQDLTSTATWTSSQTAAATIAAGGLATSTGTGTATITAASGSISGSTVITVNPAALMSIAVTPANSSFALGTTLSFTATGTYSDGSTLDLTNTAVWSIANPAIATINAQGVAASVALGGTTVTATLGSIAGSTSVTVTPAVLSSIAVTPAIPSIAAGVTQQFTATGTFTDGSTQNITATVAWSSDTPSVATISNAAGTVGLATAVAPGQATITATSGSSSGSINGSTTLTVTPVVLMSIAVTPANPSIAAGATQHFTATGTFSDGTTQDLTSTVTWASDTPATATIIAGGLSTGVAQGTATISATSGSVSGSTVLTVTNAVVVSIAINPSTATIPLGTTQQFTATGTYNDGTTQDLTQTGQWTSTVATVATISDTPGTMGLATSLAVGPTTIGLASGNVTGSAALVVNPATLASIAIAPQNSSINLGAQQQFTATGTFTDGTTQDLTSSATWSSSDATIAIIGNSVGTAGLATSAGKGTVTITATSGLISSSTTLTVTGTQLLSISVTPDNSSLLAGATQQMTATGSYSDGSSQDLTTQVVWSSSSSGIASISSTGLATAAFAGTTSISATLNSVSGATSLTVTPILLPLGTVSLIGPTTCPSPGAPKTATCTLVTVSCAGLPDLNATIVLTQPVGVPRGTVILHKGGAGTLLLDNGFPTTYVADGFTSVQIAWAADWVEAKGAGAKSAACRVATLFDYIFTTIHLSNRNAGFCGQGSSGGSATLAYALAHYGMDAYFDHTVMAAGPALSRMDYGCDPSLYQGPPLNLCSSLTNAPYAYTTAALTMFNNWEKTTSCGSANPLSSDISKWVSDSIVTSGGKYNYPQTSMSWFTCTTSPVNESTGEGKLLIDQVVPLGSTASVNCYSGVCKGEGVWGDPNAFNDTVSDMLTKCVPNHQSEAGVASHK